MFLYKLKPETLIQALNASNHPAESAALGKKNYTVDIKPTIKKWEALIGQYSKKCTALRNFSFGLLSPEGTKERRKAKQ